MRWRLKLKKMALIVLFVLLSAGLLSACGGGTMVSGEEMSGSDVTVTKGQTLTVELKGNITTGYTWVVQDVDNTLLEQSGDMEYKSDSNLAGSGGTFTFKFKALETGKTTLKMAYLRTFEKGVEPLKTFELNVTVTK
jgi:inhibitor of cysteine peptidase